MRYHYNVPINFLFLEYDSNLLLNLELTETIVGGRREGSLLDTLDMSATPMGARLFRNWLLFPLKTADAIKARLAAVEELAQRSKLRARLRELLSHITDMERLCSRLTLNQGNARDLNALGLSLARLPEFQSMLADASAPLLSEIFSAFDPLADVHGLIASAKMRAFLSAWGEWRGSNPRPPRPQPGAATC